MFKQVFGESYAYFGNETDKQGWPCFRKSIKGYSSVQNMHFIVYLIAAGLLLSVALVLLYSIMDVLVLVKNGTKKVVRTNELLVLHKRNASEMEVKLRCYTKKVVWRKINCDGWREWIRLKKLWRHTTITIL